MLQKLFGKKTITLPNGKSVEKPRSYTIPILILLIAAVCVSVNMTGFDMELLQSRGGEFFKILGDMIPPNTKYMSSVWEPLFATIKMSVIGSLCGAIIAVPFAVLASTNITKSRIVVSLVRVFFTIVRTLPTIVIALIATFVFGLGTLAGTIAIGIFTFSYVGKILFEQIETVDMGAYEAMEALGASKFYAFRYAIVPQVLPGYIANCLFCFEGNVRYASILGYVGAGGLGLILKEKTGWREYDKVGMILLMLFVSVIVIEYVSHAIRKKLT